MPPQGMDESEAGEFMAECETCHDWQHGNCMGFDSPASVPKNYFCEKCRPDLWLDLLQCALPHLNPGPIPT